MVHPRIDIRDAFRDKLQGANLTDGLGNSVFLYVNRSYPLTARDCPAALVYMEGESVTRFQEAPRLHQRQAQYLVDIAVQDADPDDATGPDDTVAEILRQVEAAILVDETLNGTVDQVEFSDLSELGEASANDGVIMAQTITFTATYYTSPDADPADLYDLTGVYTEWRFAEPESPDDDPEAVDDTQL